MMKITIKLMNMKMIDDSDLGNDEILKLLNKSKMNIMMM